MNKSYIKVHLAKDIRLITALKWVQNIHLHPFVDHIQITHEEDYKIRNFESLVQTILKKQYQNIGKTRDLPKEEDPDG